MNIGLILHLLDDFLIVASSVNLCQDQLDFVLSLCSYLGIPMAPEKTCGPASTLSFAGIELDSICSEARLPIDKIHKSTQLISEFLGRKKLTLKEVQSLSGLLNFACSVIKPGRAFLRRLIDLTVGIRSPHHLIRLNKEVKEDLKVWLSFLTEFNGRSFFIDDVWQNSSKLSLYTDASGALGFGAIFGSRWCYGKWPSDWAYCNIAFLEFYLIVLSLYLWGHEMSNQCVLFFTDNEALVHVINKQSCKDKPLMRFVRKLVSICLQHNIVLKAKHIPGIYNHLADSVSLTGTDFQTFGSSTHGSMPHRDSPLSAASELAAIVSSQAFFIIQMLKGYCKLGARLDSRLPITLPILHKIIVAASRFSCSKYQICQFQAMCSIAFYAFLRVGEMTSTNRQGPRPLQIHQVVKLVNNSNSIVSLKLTFQDFKHSYNQPPFSIVITRAPTFCLVQLMLDYLTLRGYKPGPLFMTSHGHPVSRTAFTDQLSLALKFCELNPERYKGHSFRIGAASHAADRGLSDTQIRVLGRWRSHAFHRYIRIPLVST